MDETELEQRVAELESRFESLKTLVLSLIAMVKKVLND